ncbi:hypothetical protein [Zobellia uliginosa]|uniref:hypothetical protein n=1 Tax=Zobellia uliginosa TaxID=143224 RepID=UPI001C076F7C|nr:hypothetical protein [Zobellia uliginosa]MBU2948280.1 hypothetical protein [Zobellia uliginosa]
MKAFLLVLCSTLIGQSCIPLRVAPSIKDYKISKGKKFKRTLSKRTMFIFEDHKEASHFYNYINTKFQLNDENVYDDIPFLIDGENYFFAFYEIDIPTKVLNLGPTLFSATLNAALSLEDDEGYVGGDDVIRTDNWYLAIEVYSDKEKDCLHEDSFSREPVLNYLRTLKKEYLTTHNYNETVFKN